MINNIEKETSEITKWIKNYVEDACSNGVIIGNSGGKDCATVISLCTKALGKENVLTVFMPCNSISADYEDAKLVSDTFGVPLITIDIKNAYDELIKQIDKKVSAIDEWREKEAKINVKPRLRMSTLYYIGQERNLLVAGTGNKCEAIVGYTTKWGDNASDFNPLAEFTVEEVLQIGEYLEVPERVIHKAPNDGLGGLTDEEKLGVTYKQIAQYIETGTTDKEALKIIKKKEQQSLHKRVPIPVYHRLRT